jgi:acyl-CoA thioester hydrolase
MRPTCEDGLVRTTVDPPTDPSAYPFVHSVRVRFAETDAMAVVHHAAYLPYLEEARVAYLRSVDHPYTALRDDGVELPVVEVGVRYLRPLRFDDVVDVHLAYLLTVDGEPRATAVTVHGVLIGGRPGRAPEWLRALVDGT